MRFLTSKRITQKIVIGLLIIILTTFSIPKPVQADVGGKLMSPIITLATALLDGVQHLLEFAMLGETTNFMKDAKEPSTYNTTNLSGKTITVEKKLDGSFFGLDAVNVPVINYTPEEIFSNRIPALDINFIKPAVIYDGQGNENDNIKKMNIALKLQPTIASWYSAIRAIAMVGLLSVLVYLGIRMFLTSIAADRAKYKQMLMDWVVAMCLIFLLHYVMSFTLTIAETITAMIEPNLNSSIIVDPSQNPEVTKFGTNLMGYVRFMIQCPDLFDKLAFFFLYLMLVIYSIRFTWIYLKRVVNMAFLTLISPMVALTYPIDKVGDGKAQAFNMWLKEYIYNALLQPLHLLLYTALLGSALELAIDNPLYAIVCLAFIISAEKLLKKMLGFDKASGGTLGSLAGAAGVTAMAGKALNSIGSKVPAGGGKGKVRTKDLPERQGKDAGVNSPFDAFKGKKADDVIGAGTTQTGENNNTLSGGTDTPVVPPPSGLSEEEQNEYDNLKDYSSQIDGDELSDRDKEKMRRLNELEQKKRESEQEEARKAAQEEHEEPQYDNPFVYSGEKEQNIFDVMKQDTGNFFGRVGSKVEDFKDKRAFYKTEEGKRQRNNAISDAVNRRAIGAWKALPTVGYKAARGTLRTTARAATALALGATAGVIGATTGDGDKAVSMALGAGGVGWATGDNLFEATAGKVMKDKSVRDAYGAGKYGNRIDARNARADKEYLRSEKFDDFYEKYYKGKNSKVDGKVYTKKQIQDITKSYRQAGITSEKDIRRAIKLEEKYRMESNGKLSEQDARQQVQNIVQSYGDIDLEKKAFTDDNVKQKEIERIAGMLSGGATPNNRKMAAQIFKGYEDWRNT